MPLEFLRRRVTVQPTIEGQERHAELFGQLFLGELLFQAVLPESVDELVALGHTFYYIVLYLQVNG